MMVYLQLAIFILVSFSFIALTGFSFQLVYLTTRSFIFSIPAMITLSPYLFLCFYRLHFSIFLITALTLSIVLLLSIVLEKFIYTPQKARSGNTISILVSSLGVYIVLQNIVSVFWGDNARNMLEEGNSTGYRFFNAYVTGKQVSAIGISIVLQVVFLLLIKYSTVGKKIQAVSSDSELSMTYGINSGNVILWATAISAFLAASAGILIGLNIPIDPSLGFNYFISGMIAFIIGGIRSYRGILIGALVLALIQNISGFYFDMKWTPLITFVFLILFLLIYPAGLGNLKLKKTTI